MTDRAPLPPIQFEALAAALLARSHLVVPAWLPGGHQKGHEYVCGGLSGGEGSSCSVNLNNGRWSDFATDEKGGDLLALYAAIHGLSQAKAAISVARDEGLEDVAGVQPDTRHQRPERPPAPPAAAPKPREAEGWTTVRPVPAMAPPPTFKHHHRAPDDIMRTSVYRVGEEVHGYVVRFRTSDGGKDDLPYTWCQSARDGACKWHWKQFDEPRPLYLPAHRLPSEGQTVILVEGEKKADVLQTMLDTHAWGVYAVVSWPGGCKAWQKADWSWLKGFHVLAWPDCDSKREPLTAKERNACADEAARTAAQLAKPYLPAHKQPGMKAMLGIGHLLTREHGCKVQLLAISPPGVKPDGWDAADAIETDGWDMVHIYSHFATAYALPPEDGSSEEQTPEVVTSGNGDGGKKIDPPVGTEGGDSGGRGPHWLMPFWNKKKFFWMVSRELVIAALENDDRLNGVLAYNQLANAIEMRRPMPWPHAKAGPITGSVDLLLGRYLSLRYGLPAISRAALSEAIETVALQNPYHPVQDYLLDLNEREVWDGVARLDKWLVHVIGESDKTLPDAVYRYLCLVGRYWLLGMVNRAMDPGCKFDYCPVLEGPGGLRKSTLVKTLASKEWFSDTHFDVSRGKEGQEQVQGLWVYEIAEMAQFSKAEVELIKAFISAEVDRYRPSYGRTVEKFPRQCVMAGTTNQKQWLRDRTGNRRFWPIPVRNTIRIDWLAKFRDQLMAEAFVQYLQGERYHPDPEEEDRLFKPMQESRLVESTVMSALLEVLTRDPTATGIGSVVNNLADFVTMKQICEALHVDAGKSSAALDSQIRGWLEHEGWTYCKKQINGVRAHGWARPKDWPPQDPPESAGPAADAGPSLNPDQPDDEPF